MKPKLILLSVLMTLSAASMAAFHPEKTPGTPDCAQKVFGPLDPVFRQEGKLEKCTFSPSVVVVGGGISGLTAATLIQQAGISVLLVERKDTLGGAMKGSSLSIISTGSKFQSNELEEHGDSAVKLKEELYRTSGPTVNKALLDSIINNSTELSDWISEELRLPYFPRVRPDWSGVSPRRIMTLKARGSQYAEELLKKFQSDGGTLLTGYTVNRLLMRPGNVVTGVEAKDSEGREVTIRASEVLLATGGFGANKKLRPEDKLKGVLFYGSDSEDGNGLELLKTIKPALVNMDEYKIFPNAIEVDTGRALVTTASAGLITRRSGAILVDKGGKRVINENTSLNELTQKTLQQPNRCLYLLMDQKAFDKFRQKAVMDHLVQDQGELLNWQNITNHNQPVLVKADSLTEAAQKMGIDSDQLQKTVQEWNKLNRTPAKDLYGRQEWFPLSSSGPYYILEQKPRYATSLGGVKVDRRMKVLNDKGQVVKGLFAIGGLVGGYASQESKAHIRSNFALGSAITAAKEVIKTLSDEQTDKARE